MTRRIMANVLMVIGAWYGAVYLSYWLTIALIPINNRLVYEGDTGVLLMSVWSALPLAAMAGIAVFVLLGASEVKRKGLLIVILAGLFLYSGSLRVARGKWETTPETIDRVGTIVRAVTPAAVCLLVGLYASRRHKKS